MDKPKSRMILIIILALITSGLVYNYLQGLQKTALDESNVVVACQKVTAGTRITSSMVRIAKMPLKYIHPGAVTVSSTAVDKYAATDLYPDQVVLKEQLTSARKSNEMKYKIPEGKRAMTIEISQVSGVAGYLKPGSRIDMIICFKPETGNDLTQSLTLLQNIEVLAVGSQVQKSNETSNKDNITLAVTPQEAQWVTLAENTGKIKLTLRPANDNNNVPIGISNHQVLMSPH
ncbi:MAG TPA: Flp pilus assembly protein CpaB [Syntrophomonadaceae bacterium]|nr:Flp pilus assembly protein CpaB [Syntrophomonadaceae bacterium]